MSARRPSRCTWPLLAATLWLAGCGQTHGSHRFICVRVSHDCTSGRDSKGDYVPAPCGSAILADTTDVPAGATLVAFPDCENGWAWEVQ